MASRRPSRIPPAPICLGGERSTARAYVTWLEAALQQDQWRRRERAELVRRWKLWILRANGLDPYFDTYGTFGRQPGQAPPTATDVTVLKWRRQFPEAAKQAKAQRKAERRARL